ncbi:MAG: hypothetical protein LIO58_00595 [Oscillospiraceae bacterium]|nr:hypothetical protein [Oscillospiraceae bacterium]
MPKKTYVKVNAQFDTAGHVMPTSLCVGDSEYVVDRVLEIKKAASMKVGGLGLRYLVSISSDELEVYNKRCHLWFEYGQDPEMWFVVER